MCSIFPDCHFTASVEIVLQKKTPRFAAIREAKRGQRLKCGRGRKRTREKNVETHYRWQTGTTVRAEMKRGGGAQRSARSREKPIPRSFHISRTNGSYLARVLANWILGFIVRQSDRRLARKQYRSARLHTR